MDYKDEHDFSSYETDEDVYSAYNTKVDNTNLKPNHRNNNRKSNKLNKLYFVILCISFVITSLSISVAFFTASARSKMVQEIESAVVNFSLKVEKITSEEKEGLVPVKDNEILNALKGENGKQCIDLNGNNVCQIYKVSINNDSDYSTTFKSSLELIASKNSGYSNLKWAELIYSDNPTLLGDIKTMDTSNWKTSYGVGANTTGEFYIAIWISDNGSNQNDSDFGSFTGNVTFEAISGDKMTSTFGSK